MNKDNCKNKHPSFFNSGKLIMKNISFFSLILKIFVTKIDVMRLILIDESLPSYSSFYKTIQGLSDSAVKEYKVRNHKSKYNLKSVFLIQGIRITLLRIYSGKELLIQIEQPTKQLQDILSSLFLKHKVKSSLKYVELAFDFYTETKDQARILLNRMIKTIIQKYNRHESRIEHCQDGNIIFYTVDLDEKGTNPPHFIKLYIRPFQSQNSDKGIIPYSFVRMEISFNKRLLRKYKWTFPLKVEQIHDILTYNLVGFCEFNHPKFRKYILNDKQKYLQKEIETKSGRTIRSFCNVLRDQDMYVIIQFLKSVGITHYRFLDYEVLEEENLLLGRMLFELYGYEEVYCKVG